MKGFIPDTIFPTKRHKRSGVYWRPPYRPDVPLIYLGPSGPPPGYSRKNYVRKFIRALHPKWRVKVTAIEESKDLTSLSLDELIGNLKVHEMIIKKDSEIVKAKVKRKSLDLKTKKESSDEECLTFGSEDEEYAMAVRDFKKFFKRRDKNQRAFFGGSWSDSGEEDDEKVKNKMRLVAQASSEDGKVIGRGIKNKGLYVMKLGNKPRDQICLATIDENSTLWHRRLGHANMCLIQSLASKELVRNLPKLKFDQHFCNACKMGKQAHTSHKAKNIISTNRCLELLHMDLFGPSAVRIYEENRYTLVIVDDYSGYTWTRFLKEKAKAFDQFKILNYIIFGSTCQDMCDEFAKIMHDEFEMSMMSELNFFLGLQIKQMEDGIFFNQSNYIKEMLKKFELEDSKPMETPMSSDTKLTKDEEYESVDSTKYRGMIGSLLYLTISRPDIMFSVCLCARFQEAPKTSHLETVKRIFRYIKGTTHLGLWYPKGTDIETVVYADSDHVRDYVD
nr:uncharacterized mitochondrial protein AtMg00810-like [Tanacetum cinerariifolium]